MSTKLEISDVNTAVELALTASKLDPTLSAQIKSNIIKQLQAAVEADNAEEEGDDDEKAPRQKNQFTVIISDPNNELPKTDFVAWIAQLPEEDSVATVMDKVHASLYDYNTTKKGLQYPAKTIGDGFESVPRKHFKKNGLAIKTKVPVLVVKTNNVLPKA